MRFGMVGGLETRSALITVVMLSALIVDARCTCAQTYGRDVASGDWASGWVDQFGGTSGVPGVSDDAYIGSGGYPFASAQSVATVSLDDSRQVNTLTLGAYGGDAGTINIQSTGSLTVNSLSIASGGDGNLSIAPGGTLTVVNSLSAGSSTGSATIDLNGETVSVGSYLQYGPATINRGAGGGVQGSSYSIGGATTYTIEGSDSFTDSGSVYGGATVTSGTAQSLSGGLEVSGAGSTYTANADLVIGNYLQVHDGAEFDANADVFAGSIGVYNSGVLNLNSGVTLTASSLSFGFNGATMNRNGGVYDVLSLSIESGGSLDYQAGDNIDLELRLNSSSSFSLDKDLLLSFSISLDFATLNLNGNQVTVPLLFLSRNAVINHGAGGAIQGSAFHFHDTVYTLDGSDSFSDGGTVSGGATVSNTVPLILSDRLEVSGTGTSYTANADLSVGDRLVVGDYFGGGEFNVNADVSAPIFLVNNAVLNLNSGTLTTPYLGVQGTTSQNGGAYDVTSVVLSGGTSLEYGPNDHITSVLQLASGSIFSLQKDLPLTGGLYMDHATLNLNGNQVSMPSAQLSGVINRGVGGSVSLEGEFSSLSIPTGDTLNLVFDSQPAPGELDWAFRWEGDHVDELLELLGTRIIVSGAPSPVGVIRASEYGDFTYIGSITILRGDYNDDGKVDAGDYIVWRKLAGTDYDLPNDPTGGTIGINQYNTWREHFGDLFIIDSGAGASQSVPEPSYSQMVLFSVLLIGTFARHRASA